MQKKNKKSQSSVEFMANYAWTIVLAVIIFGTMSYFFANSDTTKLSGCEFGSSDCESYTVYNEVVKTVNFNGVEYNGPMGRIEFEFQNPESSAINSITPEFIINDEEVLSNCQVTPSIVGAGKSVNIKCTTCKASGNTCVNILNVENLNQIDISISYKEQDKSFLKFKKGTINSEATDMEVPEIFEVIITNPEHESQYQINDNIHFSENDYYGSAPILCNWTSNIDGVINLNDACSFDINSLSEGIHTIMLDAIDSENNYASDFITIYVTSDPINFEVNIISPINSQTYDYGDSITFESSITGLIGNLECEWDINGNLESNQCTFNKNDLLIGNSQIIVLLAEDSITSNFNSDLIMINVEGVQLVGNDDLFSVEKGSSDVTLNVLDNDDGNDILITEITQPSMGTVDISGDGSYLIYTPDPSFSGSDNFMHSIQDTAFVTPTEIININVDLEVTDDSIDIIANDDAYNIDFTLIGNKYSLDVLNNDSGNEIILNELIKPPSCGNIELKKTYIDYIVFKECESDQFTYSIIDSSKNVAEAEVILINYKTK